MTYMVKNFSLMFAIQITILNQILYKKTKISYSDTGKGNAVVLLHGFLENQTMNQDVVLNYCFTIFCTPKIYRQV